MSHKQAWTCITVNERQWVCALTACQSLSPLEKEGQEKKCGREQEKTRKISVNTLFSQWLLLNALVKRSEQFLIQSLIFIVSYSNKPPVLSQGLQPCCLKPPPNKNYTAKPLFNPTNNHKSLNSLSVFLAT